MAFLILVVDSDALQGSSLCRFLNTQGYRAEATQTAAETMKIVEQRKPDLVMLDAVLPDSDGFALMKKLRERIPNLPIICISSYSAVDPAVKAMQAGALDYLVKPLEFERLKPVIRKSLMGARQDARRKALEQKRAGLYELPRILGTSQPFQEVLEKVKRIVDCPVATVLLLGESGTGKELIAKAIHYNSVSRHNAFVEINCSAIPEGLLEAELFGHEKGAFTGAVREKKGLFELAQDGTLFLDEIGHMQPMLQAKLVKAIEEKSFRRVGGTTSIGFNGRIIAATHRDLAEAVRMGEFRHDLYYRLKVIHLTLPPLRSRGREDIILMAQFFKDSFNREYDRSIEGFTEEALAMMTDYPWPGNVRQLRNTIERAVILTPVPMISPEHLQLESLLPETASEKLDSAEKPTTQEDLSEDAILHQLPDDAFNLDEHIQEIMWLAYEKNNRNKSRTAKYLGISRDKFRYRWDKYFPGS